ncbi:MAG TPA: hybrid sensor histidine kinase/response regulator [Ktedonobacteraceae bacterium]
MHDIPYVLVVDDDTALLEALPQALSLRLTAVKVDTSDSALNALDLIQEHDYDAIVSDIKMPGMDGLALLQKIQELRPDTPTLLITGHGEHDLAVQALRGGAYDFIQKPIDRDYMVAALHRAIQTRRMRRQLAEQQRALELHALSLERIVENRTRELIEANAAKDKFLSMIAHELKTPLTTLKGRTQLLQRRVAREALDEVVGQGLKDIERSINRLHVLVNDLLDASLMQMNMFVIHRRRCDLVQLCRHLIDEYTAGSGPALRFEAPGEPIEAEVDADRIGQVLLNLLSNAHKYSPKGYPITVTVQQVGFEAVISVRDMGAGIPPEDLEHIFDEYYRSPEVDLQAGLQKGLGLGLYIAHKLVERHAGRIEVQSIPGEGSVFSVALPLFVDPSNEDIDTAKLAPHTQAVWTILH